MSNQATPTARRRIAHGIAYYAASGAAIVTAVFCGAMVVLLSANYVQLKRTDRLNAPELEALRDAFAQDAFDADLKARIRAVELIGRKAYFTSQSQINTGALLLMGAAVLLIILNNIIDGLRQRIPAPSGCPGMDSVWDQVAQRRRALAGGGAALLAAALTAAALSSRSLINAPDTAWEPSTADNKGQQPPLPEPAEAPSAAKPARPTPAPQKGTSQVATVTHKGLLTQSATFRGANGNGFLPETRAPTTWSENSNILWKVAIPLPGLSSPVVWDDRVFVSGATRDKRNVYCFSTVDGALLWTGSYETDPAASTTYEVFNSPERLMHAAPTPATNGKQVFALFANGELVAFDATTGTYLWSKVLGNSAGNAYGLSSSLLVYEDSVIASFDGDNSTLVRYHGVTGEEYWSSTRDDRTWASPILIRTSAGRDLVITHGNPETAAWDPETGDKVWATETCSGDVAPSPILAGGLIVVDYADCGFFALDPATGDVKWHLEELVDGYISEIPSLTTDGTNLYHLAEDMLAVLKLEDGSIVYESELEYTAQFASPYVVGNNLYLPCGKTTVVASIGGTEFRPLAANELEPSNVSPALMPGRIYLRTEGNLYCIGAE